MRPTTGDGGPSLTVHQLLRQLASDYLTVPEPLRRLIRSHPQITLDLLFARVRTFGWLHPAAKVRANRVRALLGKTPLLTPAEQQAWQPPQIDPLDPALPVTPPDNACSSPRCPRCQTFMFKIGVFAQFPLLFPNRPP